MGTSECVPRHTHIYTHGHTQILTHMHNEAVVENSRYLPTLPWQTDRGMEPLPRLLRTQ